MDDTILVLVVLVAIIFVVGVAVGLALSRHCKLLLWHCRPQPRRNYLEEIQIVTDSTEKPLIREQAKDAPVVVGIIARAVVGERLALEQPGTGPKRTASVEVGEIYRTASALSIYLDEVESRPHINRLMSMPSLTNPQRIIDANQINTNIEVHMDEIDLQEQVGKGGFGAVYKGTWRGAVVAVKYAVCNVEDVESLEQSIREVVLSKKMSHPNVVQTYAWTVLTGQEAAGVAAMEDEADAVKAALAKTNNTASLATAVDLVAGPHNRKAAQEPTALSPSLSKLRIKTRADSERLITRHGVLDVASAAAPPSKSRQSFQKRNMLTGKAETDACFAADSMPTLESPFANYVPKSAVFSQQQGQHAKGTQKQQRPLENISPLFERMLLASAQGISEGEEIDDAGVKRRLDMGFQEAAPSTVEISGKNQCQPLSIDELLFRGQPKGQTKEGPSTSDAQLEEDQKADVATWDLDSRENNGSAGNASRHCGAPVTDRPAPLQKVQSIAFSDVSSCISPGRGGGEDVSTPAGPRCFAGVCPAPPRSYLSRTSSLGSRSGAQTPHRTTRVRTPDSFNRHAPPGTSLFDGTEATPQPNRLLGAAGMHLPPRARRRIMFGSATESQVQLLQGLSPPGGNRQARTCARRATDHGEAARSLSRLEPVTRRKSRSLSPSLDRESMPWLKQLQAGDGATCRSTPEHPSGWVFPSVAESPADTDPLLAQKTPSDLPRRLGVEAAGCVADTTPEGNGLPELELAASGRTLSAHSCASFNSEEGFGSPMARRNRRRNSLDKYDGRGPGSIMTNEAMMVVVMEFCDLQSLHRAIVKKVFKPHGKFTKQATYRALLRTAQEIAKGMDYIHSFGIIHGDLKPGNVLLKTHRIDRRGYIAKVSDFGLSRPVNGSDSNSAAGNELGTIAYTAPEIFQKQGVTMASDVYAFGILLWEMHHCREAYEGLLEGQICHGVCDGSLRPDFDVGCPKDFRELISQCWAQESEKRPNFKDVVTQLTEIEVAYRRECHMQKPHAGSRSRRAGHGLQSPSIGHLGMRQSAFLAACPPRPLAREDSRFAV